MQDNLEKSSGYRRGFGSDDTWKILFPGTIPEFPLCEEKRNEERVISLRIMHERRKTFIIAYLYIFIQEATFSVTALQHNSAHSRLVSSSISHATVGMRLAQQTQLLGRTNQSKQSAIMQLYCFLLGKLPLSLVNTRKVRASQSHLHQGLQLPVRLCSGFNYYLLI